VLTFNTGIFERLDDPETADVVERILVADEEWTDADPEARTLFAYVVARPRKAALDDAAVLAAWTAEEDGREAAAARDGNRYYPDTLLGGLYDELDRLRREAERFHGALYDARQELEARPPVSVGPAAAAAALRGDPRLRAVAKRVPGARATVRWARRRRRAGRAAEPGA
jgi:hypothetical protein